MKINGKPDGGGGGGVITGLTASVNGIYMPGAGVDGFAPVEVDVEFVTEPLSVSANGTYTPGTGVDGYSQVSVNVIPPLQGKSVSVNGQVTPDEGYYGLSVVNVEVPIPSFVTETLSVSDNGTYTPGQGVDGFSQVTVDVPQSVTGYTDLDLTEGKVDIVNLNNSASFVASNAFILNKTIQTVSLPECGSIYSGAFQSCISLQSVYAPKCTYIGDYAFQSCNLLQNVYAPKCSNIGIYAFQKCSSLSQVSFSICNQIGIGAFISTPIESIYLPVCSIIGNYAFNDCKSLSVLDLPVLVSAGQRFIERCTSLTTIYLCSETYTIPSYFLSTNNIGVVNSIYTHYDNISKFAVASGWSSVSSLFIGIGDPDKHMLSYSNGVVSGYTKIVNQSVYNDLGISENDIITISLPECSYVGNDAFRNCKSLQNVILPNCYYLSGYAFYGVGSYRTTSVSFTFGYSQVVSFSLYNNPFTNAEIASIFVPASLVDAYKADINWSYLSSKIFPIV